VIRQFRSARPAVDRLSTAERDWANTSLGVKIKTLETVVKSYPEHVADRKYYQQQLEELKKEARCQ